MEFFVSNMAMVTTTKNKIRANNSSWLLFNIFCLITDY